MVKAAPILIGIIVIMATFGVLQVWMSPEEKTGIKNINSLCTAKADVFGFEIPVGMAGQAILGGDAQKKKKKARYMTLLIDYGWAGYALGALLIFVGLMVSGKSKEIHHYHSPSSENSNSKKTKHCGECGAELTGSKNFCAECGSKI